MTSTLCPRRKPQATSSTGPRVAGATAEAFTPASLVEVDRSFGRCAANYLNVICDWRAARCIHGRGLLCGRKAGARCCDGRLYGWLMPAPWLRWAMDGLMVVVLVLVARGLWPPACVRLRFLRKQEEEAEEEAGR